MKLSYRGTAYDYPLAPTLGQAVQSAGSPALYQLYYRGVPYLVDSHRFNQTSVVPISYQLLYRGVTYWAKQIAQEITAVAQQVTLESGETPVVQKLT